MASEAPRNPCFRQSLRLRICNMGVTHHWEPVREPEDTLCSWPLALPNVTGKGEGQRPGC